MAERNIFDRAAARLAMTLGMTATHKLPNMGESLRPRQIGRHHTTAFGPGHGQDRGNDSRSARRHAKRAARVRRKRV